MSFARKLPGAWYPPKPARTANPAATTTIFVASHTSQGGEDGDDCGIAKFRKTKTHCKIKKES